MAPRVTPHATRMPSLRQRPRVAWKNLVRSIRREVVVLILSRKQNEAICIGDTTITVNRIRGNTVSIGIEAPRDIPVHRKEVYETIKREQGDSPRFAETYCSQCGRSFGPGNHGYSHCKDHGGGAI